MEVTVGPLEDRRSLDQNKRYHAIVAEIAEQVEQDGKRYHPDLWKEHFKRTFIGTRETVLPDGTVLIDGISTTTLKRKAFSEYMMEIEAWAIERNVHFTEPATRYLSEWRADLQRAHGARSFT